jgi:hypothetical protein
MSASDADSDARLCPLFNETLQNGKMDDDNSRNLVRVFYVVVAAMSIALLVTVIETINRNTKHNAHPA